MAEEINFKVKFAQKYFDKGRFCNYDINFVDIVLKNKKDEVVLYIESKDKITQKQNLERARAQVILTNKKQDNILNQVALIYKNEQNDDMLELIKCDDSVMFHNDINWSKETPSQPSKDAIEHINNRLVNKIKTYKNGEIKELYESLQKGQIAIHISLENAILVFNEWKNSVIFGNEIKDEQDLINLFLVDMLNGTKYKKDFVREERDLWGDKSGEIVSELEEDLIREGTNLKSTLSKTPPNTAIFGRNTTARPIKPSFYRF